MVYTKHPTWIDKGSPGARPVMAADLNEIEEGIYQASLGGGGGSLTYVTSTTTPDAGTTPGQLRGYRNTSGGAVLIAGLSVPAGDYIILEWDGSAWAKIAGTGTAPGPDTTRPSSPGAVTATPTSDGYTLAWGAATDDVAVTGYEVQLDGGSWVDSGADLAHTFTALSAGSTHSGAVRAYDAAGNRSLTPATWGPADVLTPTFDDAVLSLSPTSYLNLGSITTGQASVADEVSGTWTMYGGTGSLTAGPPLMDGDTASWDQDTSTALYRSISGLATTTDFSFVFVTGRPPGGSVVHNFAPSPNSAGTLTGADAADAWDDGLGYFDNSNGARLVIIVSDGTKVLASNTNTALHDHLAINPVSGTMDGTVMTALYINANDYGYRNGNSYLGRWAYWHGHKLTAGEKETLRAAWADGRLVL